MSIVNEVERVKNQYDSIIKRIQALKNSIQNMGLPASALRERISDVNRIITSIDRLDANIIKVRSTFKTQAMAIIKQIKSLSINIPTNANSNLKTLIRSVQINKGGMFSRNKFVFSNETSINKIKLSDMQNILNRLGFLLTSMQDAKRTKNTKNAANAQRKRVASNAAAAGRAAANKRAATARATQAMEENRATTRQQLERLITEANRRIATSKESINGNGTGNGSGNGNRGVTGSGRPRSSSVNLTGIRGVTRTAPARAASF